MIRAIRELPPTRPLYDPTMAGQSERLSALRGSSARWTNHMEQLQYGYVQAVIAAAGCEAYEPQYDDGIDIEIRHKHSAHSLNQEQTARLDVQLKSTTAAPKKGQITARMSRRRFEDFALSDPGVPRIVVIMQVSATQAHWVYATGRGLSIFHRAYWVNLAGLTDSGKSDEVTIKAPTQQVFDDVALCQIMTRVGDRQRP